jgi:hypothetical protein
LGNGVFEVRGVNVKVRRVRVFEVRRVRVFEVRRVRVFEVRRVRVFEVRRVRVFEGRKVRVFEGFEFEGLMVYVPTAVGLCRVVISKNYDPSQRSAVLATSQYMGLKREGNRSLLLRRNSQYSGDHGLLPVLLLKL